MKNLSSILVVFLLSGTAGCGSKSSDDSEPVLPDFPRDAEYAADYFVQDSACQTGTGAENIASASYFEYNGQESVSKRADLSGVKSASSLSSGLITNSMYGLHQKSTCEYNGDGVKCAGKSDLVRAATLLKICQANAVFDRNSVEGVALASMANLERAYGFYRSVESHNPSLLRTVLLVLPKVEREISVKSGPRAGTTMNTVTTDNLAYTPEFIGEPAFVIYPKGQQSVEEARWKNLNLWEVPFALAHEFGHHVLRTHSGVINGLGSKNRTLSSIQKSAVPILPDLTQYKKKSPFKKSSNATSALGLAAAEVTLQRAVSVSDYWGATNEGFADLFGHYATGAVSRSLAQVDCFDRSREVDSASFSDGTLKVLDTKNLGIFQSESVSESPDDCGAPYMQSIHSIGAIIAHGIDRMYLGAGISDPKEKTRLILAWGGQMKSVLAKSKESDITMGMLVGAVLPALVTSGKNIPSGACDAARVVFPVFAEKWFAVGAYECK